ncbi:alpha/beta hydrolase [Bdellovibrionota bacterium]
MTKDKVKLFGWWLPSKKHNSPTVLFFHGNAGNISHRLQNAKFLVDAGLSVLMIDYRGYGKSEHREITENGLYEDARACWNFLTKKKKIRSENIIIFGRSMGSAVATQLATEHKCHGLILEGSFTSLKEMAHRLVPILPVEILFDTKFLNIEKISKIKLPKLFLHAEEDEICPISLARNLFEAAPEPKMFKALIGANHNNTYLINTESYVQLIVDFCSKEKLAK